MERQLNGMTKQLEKGPGTPVEFVGDKISLDIPKDALKEDGWKKDGWQINAINAPVVSESRGTYLTSRSYSLP